MERQTQTNSAGVLFNSFSPTSHQISQVISYITVKSTKLIRDHLRDFTFSWRRRRGEILLCPVRESFDFKSRNSSIHPHSQHICISLSHSLQLKMNERNLMKWLDRQREWIEMKWNQTVCLSFLYLFPPPSFFSTKSWLKNFWETEKVLFLSCESFHLNEPSLPIQSLFSWKKIDKISQEKGEDSFPSPYLSQIVDNEDDTEVTNEDRGNNKFLSLPLLTENWLFHRFRIHLV